MLFKLSLKNISKSLKDYVIYFVTLVLGIAVFYIFNAIETQTTFLVVSSNTADALRFMSDVITGMSVFIAFVLGFLVVYASRFLMKRRNREFALYMLLGMSKGSIAWILSLESILVGIFSLAAGLILGIGLSQLMSTFVAQLFEADMTQFVFTFSKDAFLKTILYFGIIMIVVAIFDIIMVGRSRLITLMQTGSRAEKVKMKNPVACVILFIVGVAVLIIAYRMVTVNPLGFVTTGKILIPIAMGAVGTFLVFWSVSGMLLTVISKIKGIYFKGLNSFTFRQLSSRMNTMVVSITIICLMLFFTISILATAFSLRTSLNRNVPELSPVDADIEKTMTTPDDADYFDEYESDEERQEAIAWYSIDVEEAYKSAGFDLKDLFESMESVYFYETQDFTYEDALGQTADEARRTYPTLRYDVLQRVMTENDYNRVAALYGKEAISLNEDEYTVICNHPLSAQLWQKSLEAGTVINVFGHELKPAGNIPVEGFVQISASQEETGTVVIPDSAADTAYRGINIVLGNYAAADEASKKEAEERLWEATTALRESKEIAFVRLNTKIDILDSSISLGAIITFLGLYLGFVFLISGAAILALKALSDSIDSKGRYHMLRQIGAEEKEITRSLARQQGLLFLIPMILAIIHSVFGISFTSGLLHAMGVEHTVQSMLLTAMILIIIYAGYFLATFISSRRVIRES